jgi:hypothetical protein
MTLTFSHLLAVVLGGVILEIIFFLLLKIHINNKFESEALEKFLMQKNDKGEYWVYKERQKDGSLKTYDFSKERALIEELKNKGVEKEKKPFFFFPGRRKSKAPAPDPEIMEAREIKGALMPQETKESEDFKAKMRELEMKEEHLKKMQELVERETKLMMKEKEIEKSKAESGFVMIKDGEKEDDRYK